MKIMKEVIWMSLETKRLDMSRHCEPAFMPVRQSQEFF
ncbi:hypothetical protein RFEPED_1072 [Rickettsia felis str. Pedreira]|uniref:Uncharacterized protein n=1 Tax=Rickettsia felis str. Pedreira TaxID=1359196 RepID=A0A0F3MSP9_RICFI|nr:hypothetical protein RFEPED_1072 [Rickettsia felis str. Pedreira]